MQECARINPVRHRHVTLSNDTLAMSKKKGEATGCEDSQAETFRLNSVTCCC